MHSRVAKKDEIERNSEIFTKALEKNNFDVEKSIKQVYTGQVLLNMFLLLIAQGFFAGIAMLMYFLLKQDNKEREEGVEALKKDGYWYIAILGS